MRSLRGRLIIIVILLIAASIASGFVMLRLFRQSATAQVGQAEAAAGRACDAIGAAYRFYMAGWHGGAPQIGEQAFRDGLAAVVVKALRERQGFEGGLWQAEHGSLAYAFPTYEGSGPKTDVPQAELPRIRAANQAALADDRLHLDRFDSTSQTLLIAACPLPSGPVAELTGWTMTRIHPFGGENYWQLMIGLAVLSAAVIGASLIAAFLVLTWSRHIRHIEAVLGNRGHEDLPFLPLTRERELDRIIAALNDAGKHLAAARATSAALARQVAAAERLAAIGRIAAGVAHEIRNPIAAMRLKAEVALGRERAQKDEALSLVIGQADRLEALVGRLLSASAGEPLHVKNVTIAPFLQACADFHRESAAQHGLTLATEAEIDTAVFDPLGMRRALDNLVLNALQAAPRGRVALTAMRRDDRLVFRVTDEGAGPPEKIRDHLFEPFVTGRADGTGLGLSIVREIAEAHGGTARFRVIEGLTTFEIEIPWRMS